MMRVASAAALLASAGLLAATTKTVGRFSEVRGGLVGEGKGAAIGLDGDSLPPARRGATFANFAARDFGISKHFGLIRAAGATSGVTVRDLAVDTGYRVIDSGARENSFSRLTVERVKARGLIRSFARIRGDSHDLIFRDIDVTFRDQPASPPELPGGIQLDGETRDVLIERVAVRGARMVPAKFTNGDGFSTERLNKRILFRNATAEDNSDGGFDLKSTETRIENGSASRNGRNYRFWGTGEATVLKSSDPRAAHVWIGKGADWRIAKLIVRSKTTAPVVRIGGAGRLRIESYDIQVPPGTPAVLDETGGLGEIDWGPQGKPPLR